MTETVCIVGLGYVGMPLAADFAKVGLDVIGYDINQVRIRDLKSGKDVIKALEEHELKNLKINFTSDENEIKKADYIIVTVPTPLTENNEPDLSYIEQATKVIGKHMKKNAVVIYESTVYPGVTEELCLSILEKESAMKCGEDFKLGYSPERINPGDKEHTIAKVVKIVSGYDKESLDKTAELYEKIVKAGVFRAANIKTAEAAKIIENTQRDLNIALMNELALIFARNGLDSVFLHVFSYDFCCLLYIA